MLEFDHSQAVRNANIPAKGDVVALNDADAVPLHYAENVALSNALQEEDCSM